MTTHQALIDWLNDVALKDASQWLDDPADPFAGGYATAIMSLCASLPHETIDQLDPRRLAVLGALRKQAHAIDEEMRGK